MSPLPKVKPDPALTARQRDFLLLSIYFQMRHGYPDRAAILAECLVKTGDTSHEALLALTVTTFAQKRWKEALRLVEDLEQSSAAKKIDPQLLAYMKLRCQTQAR